MPELEFVVRRPDDERMTCYSPSLAVLDSFELGGLYAVDDFVRRSRLALTTVSRQMAERSERPSASAEAQLARIVAKAGAFAHPADQWVRVEAFEPPVERPAIEAVP